MNDKLLDRIAKDLKIFRFRNSLTVKEYRCAVIYSATALWAKIATQDQLVTVDQGSRRHVLKVCSKFLNNALEDESTEIKSYFYTDSYNTDIPPQIKIVDSLIRVREINEIGLNPNKLILSLTDDDVRQITDDLQIVLGSIGSSQEYEFISGLSFIYRDKDGVAPAFRNNTKFVEEYLKQVSKKKPTRSKNLENDYYFDIHDWGDRKFSRRKGHDNYPFEIVMNQAVDGEIYYIKTEKGFYQFSELETELREHYRFIIYLCRYFEKKTFNLIENDDVFYLKGFHALPLYEDCLIRSILWPMRDIDDVASFFGPIEIKDYILRIFDGMGLGI